MIVELKLSTGKTLRAEMPAPFAYKKMMDSCKTKIALAGAWASKFGNIEDAQAHISEAPEEILEALIQYNDYQVNYKLDIIDRGIKKLDPKSDGLDGLDALEFDELMKVYEEHFFAIYTIKSKATGAKIAKE